MRNLKIKNQNGRSMIEMLGVLAIIGVLSVGGIAGYSKAMMKYRINKTIEQITLIAGNVRTFFATQGNYDGVSCGSDENKNFVSYSSCAIAKKAKLFPDEMLTIADGTITNIENAFGGKSAIHELEDGKTFMVAFNEIPMEACIELGSYDWSRANATSIGLTAFNGNLQSGNYSLYYTHSSLPVDMNIIITECSNITSKNYNIVFSVSFK